MLSQSDIKQKLGIEAAKLVQNDSIVGLGSGTTAKYFLKSLGERVRAGLNCRAVPTSKEIQNLATNEGMKIAELNEVQYIDLTIDGADEIDPSLQLIKGGGGALLQEKMVAAASKQLMILADDSKLVQVLGAFPLPVEVVPYGWKQVQIHIQNSYGIEAKLRERDSKTFVTDHGHYILDCFFRQIADPGIVNNKLNQIPGVVETGLFVNMASGALIGYPDGSLRTISSNKK